MATRISLEAEATAPASTFDQWLQRSEFKLKKALVHTMLWLFSISNAVVLAAVCIVFSFDQSLDPADRLITSEVIMTLIGATTVQLGVIMITVARSMFQATIPVAE